MRFIGRWFKKKNRVEKALDAPEAIRSDVVKSAIKKNQGILVTKTANYCLVCGKPLRRAARQIMYFCTKSCRRIGRGGKKNRRRGIYEQRRIDKELRGNALC